MSLYNLWVNYYLHYKLYYLEFIELSGLLVSSYYLNDIYVDIVDLGWYYNSLYSYKSNLLLVVYLLSITLVVFKITLYSNSNYSFNELTVVSLFIDIIIFGGASLLFFDWDVVISLGVTICIFLANLYLIYYLLMFYLVR